MGMSRNPSRPGTVGSHQIRMQQTVAEVAGRSAEHRLHVVRRERDVAYLDVAEVRCEPGDLVNHPLCHHVLELAVHVAVGLHRECECKRACGVLACGRHARVVHGRDLHSHRRIVRHDVSPALVPLALLFFRRIEDSDRPLHSAAARSKHINATRRCGASRTNSPSAAWPSGVFSTARYRAMAALSRRRKASRFSRGLPRCGRCRYSMPAACKSTARRFFEKPGLRDNGVSRTSTRTSTAASVGAVISSSTVRRS